MASTPLRVPIINDDERVRAQLARLLSRAHHVVHQLPTVVGIGSTVREHRIDVVVVDDMTPILAGDKLVALLRQRPRFHSLGLVLISDRSMAELQRLVAKLGADAFITKAAMEGQVVAAVERAARLRGRDRGRCQGN